MIMFPVHPIWFQDPILKMCGVNQVVYRYSVMQCSKFVWKNYQPSEMICQPNNWNMLQMLEKLSAQAIYYGPWSDGLTGISNTAVMSLLGK